LPGSGDRRRDPAVHQLQLGVIHRAFIALDRAAVLPDRRFLVVEILPCQNVLLKQLLVARVGNLRVFQRRQILRQRPLGLRQFDLVRPRIDLGQQVAGLHHLPFDKIYFIELAIHPALDRHRVVRRHRSDRRDVLFQIADRGRHRRDRHYHVLPALSRGRRGISRAPAAQIVDAD